MTGLEESIEDLVNRHLDADTRLNVLEGQLAWLDLEILDLQAKRERLVNDIQKLHESRVNPQTHTL